MKINFVVDKEYDVNIFLGLIRHSHWESRLKRSGIPYKLAEKIHNAKDKKECESEIRELIHLANTQYDICLPYIQKSTELYKFSWDEIIDEFSKTVSDLTFPWFYEDYVCVVTHLCSGVSNWNGNTIGRNWKENSFTQRRITAHEIILAHYFSIHRNEYKNSGLTDKQIWALAEIAAWALTGLEDRVTKFWPWDQSGYYTDHNYPELVKLQLELKGPFLNRRDFKEYIETGIELVKTHPL